MRTREIINHRWLGGFLVAVSLLLLGGCNESKEGRIRYLEAELMEATAQIDELERRVEALESRSDQGAE